jgi:hypothetical protein
MILLIFQYVDHYKVENFDQLLNEDVDIVLDYFDDFGETVEGITLLLY